MIAEKISKVNTHTTSYSTKPIKVIKFIKRIVLSSLSVLGIGFSFWMIMFLNPELVYAKSHRVENVTIHYNHDLEAGTEEVIKNALEIIRTSTLFDENIEIELCLNDDTFYPKLHPLAGGIAYTIFNKAILNDCRPKFDENIAENRWRINDFQLRKSDLTWLLAHEFNHVLQWDKHTSWVLKNTLGKISWKLEGHSEYISRKFKDDGLLKEKIDFLMLEFAKEHVGIPVFELEDGTIQNLAYFKYGLVFQYLTEQENLSFAQVLDDQRTLTEVYAAMLTWKAKE